MNNSEAKQAENNTNYGTRGLLVKKSTILNFSLLDTRSRVEKLLDFPNTNVTQLPPVYSSWYPTNSYLVKFNDKIKQLEQLRWSGSSKRSRVYCTYNKHLSVYSKHSYMEFACKTTRIEPRRRELCAMKWQRLHWGRHRSWIGRTLRYAARIPLPRFYMFDALLSLLSPRIGSERWSTYSLYVDTLRISSFLIIVLLVDFIGFTNNCDALSAFCRPLSDSFRSLRDH